MRTVFHWPFLWNGMQLEFREQVDSKRLPLITSLGLMNAKLLTLA